MALNDFEQRMVDSIDQHGWFGLHVMAGGDLPGFSYSVGFWESVGAPEFLIYGLPKDLTHAMLWEMFRQFKAGLAIADGERVSGLLEGFDCIIRPVHPSHFDEHVGSARWYRRHRLGDDAGLQVFQIFWPGKQQGLFPWEPGCDPAVRDCQPQLYLPDEAGLA